jgi:hypothetical protein
MREPFRATLLVRIDLGVFPAHFVPADGGSVRP